MFFGWSGSPGRVGVSISHISPAGLLPPPAQFSPFLQLPNQPIQRAILPFRAQVRGGHATSPVQTTRACPLRFKSFVSRCFYTRLSPPVLGLFGCWWSTNIIKMRFPLIQGARRKQSRPEAVVRDSSQPALIPNIIVHFRRSFSRSTIEASENVFGGHQGTFHAPLPPPSAPIKSRLKPAKAWVFLWLSLIQTTSLAMGWKMSLNQAESLRNDRGWWFG